MPVDLTTQFGGLTLGSPIVIGACPMTAQELIRIALISGGAGAIVLPSLFEEQVIAWNQQKGHGDSRAVEGDQAKLEISSNIVPDVESYLELVRRASSQKSIPLIASLNGECRGRWLEIVAQLETAGASAVEFNVKRPAPDEYEDPREVEDAIVEAAETIKNLISIPLFFKLGRQYTSMCHLARRLLFKANGLVLFGNAPEFDISMDSLKIETRWGLSEPGSIALSMETLMRVHAYCPEMPLAASGGIGDSCDLQRVLLAGADVAMITSAVYRDGPDLIGSLLDGQKIFMERNGFGSLEALKQRRPKLFDPDRDRKQYVESLSTIPAPHVIRSANRTLECDRWGHIKTSDP